MGEVEELTFSIDINLACNYKFELNPIRSGISWASTILIMIK